MGWFSNKPTTPDASAANTAPVRIHSVHLSAEPGFAELAYDCIQTAGPGHPADPVSVLTGIYNITTAQVSQWFTALRRPHDGQTFAALFTRAGFADQDLWDYLTGDPGKIAVHNQLADLLSSAQLHDIITGSIRDGNHTPTST